jgi:hypothetical protein
MDYADYMAKSEDEKTPRDRADFLRDLSRRLRHVPGMGYFDKFDTDELQLIADTLEQG